MPKLDAHGHWHDDRGRFMHHGTGAPPAGRGSLTEAVRRFAGIPRPNRQHHARMRPSVAVGGWLATEPRASTPAAVVEHADAVHESFASARTVSDVERTLKGHIKQIWTERGRERLVHVDLEGLGVQTAKEYSEALVRCAAVFPDVKLTQVGTYAGDDGEFAYVDGKRMMLNSYWGSARRRDRLLDNLRQSESMRYNTRGANNAASTVIHEFAHVLDIGTLEEQLHGRVALLVRDRAEAAGMARDELIRRFISSYATTSIHELIAEAFTDVMMNGPAASDLSQDIFDLLGDEYRKVKAG